MCSLTVLSDSAYCWAMRLLGSPWSTRARISPWRADRPSSAGVTGSSRLRAGRCAWVLGVNQASPPHQGLDGLGEGLGGLLFVDEAMGTRCAHLIDHGGVVVAAHHGHGGGGAPGAEVGNEVQRRAIGQPEVDERDRRGAARFDQRLQLVRMRCHCHLHVWQP